MIESITPSESMEAFPIPEGAILLESCDALSSRGFVISALKQILQDRNLTLPLGPELDLENPKRLLSFNNFAVQVVISGLTANEINVPLDHWYKFGAAPQILLAAQVDDENNVVWFPGVLTGVEFEALVSDQLKNKTTISLSVDQFKGGVDRLLSFVRLLEPTSIPRRGLAKQNQSEWSWEPIRKNIKSGLSIAVFTAGAIILGPEIFRPKLLGGVATLSGDSIVVSGYTRSAISGNTLGSGSIDLKSICLLTPRLSKVEEGSIPTAIVKIDKPIIMALDPLNEIKISKNGKELWSKTGTSEKRLDGPISWPIQSIEPNEQFQLSFRPKGSSYGQYAKIKLQASPKVSFQRLDTLIESLDNKESEWIKTIDQQLNKDKTVALTLLFSDKAPSSEVLDKARASILNKEECIPSNQ